MGVEGFKSDHLGSRFEKLVVFCGGGVGGGGIGGGGMSGGGVINEWKDMPMELLLMIFSLVDDRTVIAASGVCSGWRDTISWGLTHLSLSWCKKNMNELVLSLAPKMENLQVLILRQDKPQLEDRAIETIVDCCPNLRELDLSKSFKLTNRSLYALAHKSHNLSKLNISGCSAFSDSALAYLSGFCTKLKCLNLCGCVKAASDSALKAIGYNCHELQSLNLGWCENVGDEGVVSLAYGCPDLRALDLCGCVLIRDASVIAVANNCPHLRSLGLYYCHNITDKAMYSLAHSKSNIIRMYEEEGLMSLNLGQCTALTSRAVQAVCNSFPALHTCPGRHSLNISGCLGLTSVHCPCVAHPVPRRPH